MQGRNAPAVPLDYGDIGPCFQERPRKPAGPGADFVDRFAAQVARDGGNAIKQLTVEKEILAERPFCLEPISGNHIPQRGEGKCHRQSVRQWAALAAI